MNDLLSILQGLLLESPGPLGLTFTLTGVVLMFCAANQRKRSLFIAAIVLWLLGVGVFISSAMVTTQRERVNDATAVLLSATQQPMNMAAIRDKLATGAVLLGPQGQTWIEADKLPGTIETALTRWPIGRHRVKETNTRIFQRNGQLEAHVLLDLSTKLQHHDDFMLGTGTRWRIIWQQEPSGLWRVRSIQWVEWMGREPSRGMWE